MDKMKRRAFIQTSAAAGVGLSGLGMANEAKAAPAVLPKAPKSVVNIGVIGVGLRGQGHLGLLLDRSDCKVTAICDVDEYMINQAKKMVEKRGAARPKVYGTDEHAYQEMLEDPDLDAVMIATPWRWHSQMAIAAMQAGKYVGVEVCGGFSLDECWQLVNTHEETGTHLFFLENVCYRRDVMAVLQMVREGLFGELIHL